MLGGRPRRGPPCCADTACPGFRVIGFRFVGCRIAVPYTASSLELVFLVLVRYAYGFLDFLFTYNLH